jgi:NADH-quinone oxidoreductase subunit M
MTLSAMLLWMLLAPLAGAVAIAVSPRHLAKHIGLATSLVVLFLSIVFAVQFPAWMTGAFVPDTNVFPDGVVSLTGVTFTLGVDSVSLLLILLTTFLTPLALWGSYTAIEGREREFYGWFLTLLSAMLLAFMARDVIAFYVGYEFTIVPMLFLIAIFGGDDRKYASLKFFVFTFVGSVITLAALVYVASKSAEATKVWDFSLSALQAHAKTLSPKEQFWVFVALMVGFCVKVPFFPVHTWLPLAHTQAPTAGSVILAGTLLKLGTYGVYRIALPMAPNAAVETVGFLAVLCVIAVVAISLVCCAQTDMKKLVAYSSVAHMGVCMLGMLSLNPLGMNGSILYMINHGLSTGALFLCIGFMYERYHTKDMDQLSGLAKVMPIWAFFVVFFTMTSVGLPGLNGFVSEFLCLMGAFAATTHTDSGFPGLLGPKWMIVAGVGSLIFGAVYMLYMVGRVVWGPLKAPGHGDDHGHGAVAAVGHAGGHGAAQGAASGAGSSSTTAAGSKHDDSAAGGHGHRLPTDLSAREIAILAPLAVICLVIGIHPYPLLDVISPSTKATLAGYPEAVRDFDTSRASRGELATAPAAPAEPTAAADASTTLGSNLGVIAR